MVEIIRDILLNRKKFYLITFLISMFIIIPIKNIEFGFNIYDTIMILLINTSIWSTYLYHLWNSKTDEIIIDYKEIILHIILIISVFIISKILIG